MNFKTEWKKLLAVVGVFAACFYLPVGAGRFDNAVGEALALVKWYAREHVLLCLVPAFFIAGGISVFVSQASVMKYLGAKANKVLAYGVASVSGSVLAVCSCTVLPLFAGIYRMGAGLGPASAFLYSGPAINVLAIILTARVLGLEMGIARAVGAVVFSIVIGLAMHFIFRREEIAKANAQAAMPEVKVSRPLWKNAVYFATMVGILVFANWARSGDVRAIPISRPSTRAVSIIAKTFIAGPEYKNAVYFATMVGILVFANWARSGDVRAVFLCCPGGLTTYNIEGTLVGETEKEVTIVDTGGQEHKIPAELMEGMEDVEKRGVYEWIHRLRWFLVAGLLALFAAEIWFWFVRAEVVRWIESSWGFAKLILPLLLIGVLAAGFLLGRPGPGNEGVIPNGWVNAAVGGNSIWANLFAAVAGAFMYFATLTEVPILQGLMGAGMGKGPALALLLAGPALSLPNMLVIRSVMGTKKTAAFVLLVIIMATVSGMVFGTFY